MIILLIIVICFILYLKYIEYDREKILKNTPKKKGQETQETYIKWKKGQL